MKKKVTKFQRLKKKYSLWFFFKLLFKTKKINNFFGKKLINKTIYIYSKICRIYLYNNLVVLVCWENCEKPAIKTKPCAQCLTVHLSFVNFNHRSNFSLIFLLVICKNLGIARIYLISCFTTSFKWNHDQQNLILFTLSTTGQ